MRVYPRVCGGTAPPSRVAVNAKGLSPRVRGNRESVSQARRETGSIPACAGEPPFHGLALDGVGVYPRVCGGTRRQRAQR